MPEKRKEEEINSECILSLSMNTVLQLTSSKDGIGLNASGDGSGGGEGDLPNSAITSSLYVLISSRRVIESLRRGGWGGGSSKEAVLSDGARETLIRSRHFG